MKKPIEEMGTGEFTQYIGNKINGTILDYLDDEIYYNSEGEVVPFKQSVKKGIRAVIWECADKEVKVYLKHRIRVLEHMSNRDLGSEQEPDEVTEI